MNTLKIVNALVKWSNNNQNKFKNFIHIYRSVTNSTHSIFSTVEGDNSNLAEKYDIAKPGSIISKIKDENSHIAIKFTNNAIHNYHYIWLRDHCRCNQCFNSVTQQRELQTVDIPLDIKPRTIDVNGDSLSVTWPDNHVSSYSSDMLLKNHYGQPTSNYLVNDIKRIFWGKEIMENMPSSHNYYEVIENEVALLNLLKCIATYGFATVSDTPTNMDGMRKLFESIGSIRHSFYGALSEITNQSNEDLDFKDTAWTNIALPSHNDGTYFYDSPGLQCIHIYHHDGKGGESVYVDGIKAAIELREKHPDAYKFLVGTPIAAHYREPNRLMEMTAPIIKEEHYTKEIYQVRINGNDRKILNCLTFDQVEKFYSSLNLLMRIITDEENEIKIKLPPGDCFVFNNWRLLHGRTSFTGTRTFGSCYFDMDEFMSKLKSLKKAHEN